MVHRHEQTKWGWNTIAGCDRITKMMRNEVMCYAKFLSRRSRSTLIKSKTVLQNSVNFSKTLIKCQWKYQDNWFGYNIWAKGNFHKYPLFKIILPPLSPKKWRWSGLVSCNKNQKNPGSITIRRSAGLRDPTSLRDSRWPSGRKCKSHRLTPG